MEKPAPVYSPWPPPGIKRDLKHMAGTAPMQEPLAEVESSAVIMPSPAFRRLVASPDLNRPLSNWVQMNQPDGSFGLTVITNGEVEYWIPLSKCLTNGPQQFYTTIPAP